MIIITNRGKRYDIRFRWNKYRNDHHDALIIFDFLWKIENFRPSIHAWTELSAKFLETRKFSYLDTINTEMITAMRWLFSIFSWKIENFQPSTCVNRIRCNISRKLKFSYFDETHTEMIAAMRWSFSIFSWKIENFRRSACGEPNFAPKFEKKQRIPNLKLFLDSSRLALSDLADDQRWNLIKIH